MFWAWLKKCVKITFLVFGFLLLLSYLFLRIWFINFSPFIVIFSVLLFLAELHNLVQFFTMLYSLWPRNYIEYKELYTDKKLQLHIFICVCGEPVRLVESTIMAAKKAQEKYLHTFPDGKKPRVIVLNDGYAAKKKNWHAIELLSKKYGVTHIARTTTQGYKAGNINNGLLQVKTKDPDNTIDIVLDADFAVVPEFLLEITKPFADATVDFVQTPQRYKHNTTWVAQAASAHQEHFFRHVCPAKAYDNGLFLCGTNFAIKRKALLSVDGMDERFITEDYATSLNLHLRGKKGVFIPTPLAYGVAPGTLKAYFSQQQRWSKGTFDTSLAYARQIFFGSLTYRQKFQYIVSSIYYLSGLRNAIFMLAPLPYLFFGVSLMKTNAVGFFTLIYGPLFLYNFLVYFFLFNHPLKSWVLDTISFPVFIVSFLSSITKKKLAFIVTIKKYQRENVFSVYKVQLVFAVTLFSALAVGLQLHHLAYTFGEYINYFWVIFNASILSLGFYLFIKGNYISSLDTFATNTLHRNANSIVTTLERTITIATLTVILCLLAYQNTFLQQQMRNIAFQFSVQAEGTSTQTLSIPTTGVYYGYYLPSLNKHVTNPMVSLDTNDTPSLALFYQDWYQQKPFDITYMNALSDKGVIPIITWEPWDGTNQFNIKQPQYAPRLIASGKYDAYIHEWAREAAAYNKPYFLRFAHEMNGNWYPWGNVNGNTPKEYIAMWRHVHDIFVEEGATNTIWIWAPNNTDEKGSAESVMSFYPGAKYVDWVGYSGFNWGNTTTSSWTSFEDVSATIYGQLSVLNKPIMVAETSTVGTSSQKEAWIQQAAQSLTDMPQIKAVLFYNAVYKDSNFSLSSGKQKEIVSNFEKNSYFLKHAVLTPTNTYGEDTPDSNTIHF